MPEDALQRALRQAVQKAGIIKPASIPTSSIPSPRIYSNPATTFAVKSTMIYTHVLNRGGEGVMSPFGPV